MSMCHGVCDAKLQSQLRLQGVEGVKSSSKAVSDTSGVSYKYQQSQSIIFQSWLYGMVLLVVLDVP